MKGETRLDASISCPLIYFARLIIVKSNILTIYHLTLSSNLSPWTPPAQFTSHHRILLQHRLLRRLRGSACQASPAAPAAKPLLTPLCRLFITPRLP